MEVVLFEDYDYDNFYPLSLTRPIFHLRFGTGTLKDRHKYYFPTVSFSYLIRAELKEAYKDLPLFDFSDKRAIKRGEDYLFILSSLLFEGRFDLRLNEVLLIDDKPVAFRLSGEFACRLNLALFFKKGLLFNFLRSLACSFLPCDKSFRLLSYLFDFVISNGLEITSSLEGMPPCDAVELDDSVIVVGDRSKLFVSKGVRVYPGSCFILDDGPIFIDEGSVIMPFSVVEGPCYIGRDSVVEGARVRGGTSIGNVCKIAGEIESSIVMDYTNKHHDGFLGNSYLGSFVNLGAMSTTSDLKNNYSCVTITLKDRIINTPSIKIGSFIGDHSKLGVGSLLNTGTVIGVGCNLYFNGAMYPKYVPSFVWGSNYPFDEYIFERFIKTTEIVLERRSQVLTKECFNLLQAIFVSEQKIRNYFLDKIS